MLLSQLYGGKERPSLSIFSNQTTEQKIISLLVTDILSPTHDNEDGEDIVVLCYRNPPTVYQSTYKTGSRKVIFKDCFSDPFGWLGELESPAKNRLNVEEELSGALKHAIVVVDDLLLFGRAHDCIDDFGRWNGLFVDLLCRISRDNYLLVFVNPKLLDDAHVRILMHIASYYANITTANTTHSFKCHSVLRKSSGKVVVARSILNADKEGKLTSSDDTACNSLAPKDSSTASSEVDPASNLTFNLRLTDSEREARANTALPYLLTESKKSAYLHESAGVRINKRGGGSSLVEGGEIVYVPDEVDDFDDEDPDDDLDI